MELKISKRNIIKIISICFWGYMAISLIFTLMAVLFTVDWSQIVTQYSPSEIIIECATCIAARCNFKKYKNYFNIFRT